jgi:hypothetical protein
MPAKPDPSAPPGTLLVADVARIFQQEARKRRKDATIQPATVLAYRKQSKPMVGAKPGMYADNPMPEPDGYLGGNGRFVWWAATREQELRDWFNSRKTQGHGEGGPRAGAKRRAATGG